MNTNERVCCHCKALKELSLFYRDKNKFLGREHVCKECRHDKYKEREQYHREYRQANKQRIREGHKRWLDRNRRQHNANRALIRAVNSGKIKRDPCIVCGNPKSEGHHTTYLDALKVIWLCKEHHGEIHRKNFRHYWEDKLVP